MMGVGANERLRELTARAVQIGTEAVLGHFCF